MEHAVLLHGHTWGPWILNARNWTLIHVDAQYYEIYLENIRSSALLLDYIFQIAGKQWCSESDAGYLLKAFQELFHPQRTLCSSGVAKAFDPTTHLKKMVRMT